MIAAGGSAAAAPPSGPAEIRGHLTDARWTAAETDLATFLTMSPGECLKTPAAADDRYLVEVGRAAFRSPLLLGGPAARGGLSCSACHRDGHDNPDFFLEGLSAAPGTADVTSSLFSKTREDGVFNPRPIPTLVGVGEKATFGEMAKAESLHAFITGAVIDEFQGATPSPAIIDGVARYVAHLDPAACSAAPVRASVGDDMDAADRALAAALGALARGDVATADFLLLSAQAELGRVHERFLTLPRAQPAIEALGKEIGGLRSLLAEHPDAARQGVEQARVRAALLANALDRRRGKSLYDAGVITKRLGERQSED